MAEPVASLRAKAELARRLANEFQDPKSINVLLRIAGELEVEANNLENARTRLEAVKPKPSQDNPR